MRTVEQEQVGEWDNLAQPVYRRQRMQSKLNPFKPLTDQWLAANPRLLAARAHQHLVRDY